MKDWVRSFLIQEFIDSLGGPGKSEEGREKKIKQKTKELENSELAYEELANLMQCDFGNAPAGESSVFSAIFGSVLADLPEDVFKKLSEMKNVLYIFTPFPWAEVKIFDLSASIKEGQIRIVNFPNNSLDMTQKALKGEIAYGLARVLSGLKGSEDESADETLRNWGFEKELKALKDARAAYYQDMLPEK
jgi:hypothetical protein